MTVASERSVLVLSLRSPSPLATVAWMTWLITHLAEHFHYGLADFCDLSPDGSDLMDYSRVLTVVLQRGL
jgi:hypothetical protein